MSNVILVGAKLLPLKAEVPKGKTTAAIGQGVRATGHGFKVYMIQFLKGNYKYGEINAIKAIPNFELKQLGSPELIAEPGDFELWVGGDSTASLKESFTVTE